MNKPADQADPSQQPVDVGEQPPASADAREEGAPPGAPDDHHHSPVVTTGPESDAPLEMRQVAGLTAGSATGLRPGTFQFHESETDVGFAVTVRNPDEVFVVPGQVTAHVDEILLEEPTPLYDAVLNVGSACFTVRRPRPAPSPESRLAAAETRYQRAGAITVPDLPSAPGVTTQSRSHRFGALFSPRDDEDDVGLDPEWWRFLEQIRDVRSHVAERHRWLHPDPEELRARLQRMDPGLWDRGREHPLFGRVALAYATIPWEPRFDAPERIPTPLHVPIREMSRLPWVPVTANLGQGPLGIAGSRAAVLAATRFVLLSLCSLMAPSEFMLSIVTAKGLVRDWSWTSALPNSLFPDGADDGFLIAVADGMSHFDGAGFSHEAVLRNEMGLIALAETPGELPEYCETVLVIGPDGRCQLRNHLGEQIIGTPIGVTAQFAAEVAAMITEAVGDAPRPATHPVPPAPEPPTLARPDEPEGIADTATETVTNDAEPDTTGHAQPDDGDDGAIDADNGEADPDDRKADPDDGHADTEDPDDNGRWTRHTIGG